MVEHSKNHFSIGQEINLFDWLCTLWIARKLFLRLGIAAIVVGNIIAFSIPKEYTTRVKLVPESVESSTGIRNQGGFVDITGIDLSSTSGEEALSPKLYPYVIQSTPFLLDLFSVKVTYKQGEPSITLFQYMRDHQQCSWWNSVFKFPLQVLSAMGIPLPIYLTESQELVLQALQNRIGVAVDNTTGVILISAQMQDPLISAEVVQAVVEGLQKYIMSYRTRKAKNDLAFTERVFAEAREAYFNAQKAYAAFEDTNRNLISSSFRTEQERLKNEMTQTFKVYHTLARKLEQDKLHVQEQTPVYTLIEPAIVPLQASSPQKPLVLTGFLFLAFFGGIAYLIIQNWIISYRTV